MFTAGTAWSANACLNFAHGFDIYAYGYRAAADQIVQHVLETGRSPDYLVYPICFLYRQYLELRLKAIIRDGSALLEEAPGPYFHHRLRDLWSQARSVIHQVWPDDDSSDIEDAVGSLISDFSDLDPNSETFRYPEDRHGGNPLAGLRYINLENVAKQFNEAADILEGVACGISVYREYQRERMEG